MSREPVRESNPYLEEDVWEDVSDVFPPVTELFGGELVGAAAEVVELDVVVLPGAGAGAGAGMGLEYIS